LLPLHRRRAKKQKDHNTKKPSQAETKEMSELAGHETARMNGLGTPPRPQTKRRLSRHMNRAGHETDQARSYPAPNAGNSLIIRGRRRHRQTFVLSRSLWARGNVSALFFFFLYFFLLLHFCFVTYVFWAFLSMCLYCCAFAFVFWGGAV